MWVLHAELALRHAQVDGKGRRVSCVSSQMHWPDLRGSVRKEGCGAQQLPGRARGEGPTDPGRNCWGGQASVCIGCWRPTLMLPLPAQLPLLLCLPEGAADLTPPLCPPVCSTLETCAWQPVPTCHSRP